MSKNKYTGNIGIAQINPRIGDLKYNAEKIEEYVKKADSLNLDIIIFPEMALLGLPYGNILERYPFLIEENVKWLNRIAEITKNSAVVIEFTEPGMIDSEIKYNASIAILRNGKIEKIIQKQNCNYLYELNNIKYLITSGDMKFLKKIPKYTDILINCNSIPSRTGSYKKTDTILSAVANKNKISVIYVNQVGAVDNYSFDGTSRIYNAEGNLSARAKAFEEDFLVVNSMSIAGNISSIPKGMENAQKNEFSLNYEDDLERTYKTVIQGIKDYFNKCGLKRAVLGLSGGLDSTVCAVLLTDALGKENVIGISLPSKITSNESKSDAKKLANNLGIAFYEAPIKTIVETATEDLNNLFNNIETGWKDRYKDSYTPDNIQARSRATYLWCISNEFPSCIPIATSDKSEAYMGYATINGDMTGGFAPIADITKTKLFALARWLNANREEKNVIPESVIKKRPGAELAINPKTGKPLFAEDALMPYEFLDEIIWRIENKNDSYKDLMNSEFLYEKNNTITKDQKRKWLDKFYKRMSAALYKWSIFPPSVIVDSHSINKSEYYQPITSKVNYEP